MAITVKFYQNLSDNRCMDKELIPLGRELTCDVYEPINYLNPTFTIDINNFNQDANYCIIDEFNRKYFIRSVVPFSAKRLLITCHVDVLSTYEDEIRNCPLIAARSTNNVNYYLEDSLRLFNSYSKNQYLYINGTRTDSDLGAPGSLILITA